MSEAFVRLFVELVGHYPLHMVESPNGNKELQRDSFRKSHPSRGVRQFLQLFMDTQMFAGFIQDKELRKGGGRGHFFRCYVFFLFGNILFPLLEFWKKWTVLDLDFIASEADFTF